MSRQIEAITPDDLLISRVTNAIIATDIVLSGLTLPVSLTILYILMKDHSFSGSFFTIYKVGLVYDIVSIVSVHVICVFPTRGMLLSDEFVDSQLYLKLFCFVIHFTRVCQAFTNPILCLNRATAVLLPLYYDRVWESRFMLPFCFILQFLGGLTVAVATLFLDQYLKRYPTGERFPMVTDTPLTRAMWLVTTGADLAGALLMWMLYGVIIWKFRSKIAHHSSKAEKADSRRAFFLLIIAINVLFLETVYCLFYGYSFVTNINYKIDFRIFMAKMFTLVDVYTCMPTFLILFFCKPVSDQVVVVALNCFCARRKNSVAERKVTVKSLT